MQGKKSMFTGGWKGLAGGTGAVELPEIKQEIQQGPRLGLGWAAAPQFPLPVLGAGSKEENQHHPKGSGLRTKHFKGRRLIAKSLQHHFLQDPRK